MSRSDIIRKAATPSDAFRNPVLENVSTAAFQDPAEFVARSVFPTIGGGATGKYYEIDTDSIAQNKAAKRSPGDEAQEGTWNLSQTAYTTEQLGYREKIPEELLSATGAAAKADTIATQSVAEVMLIASEVDWATRFFKTGVWARDIAGASTNVTDVSYIYWSTPTTSTPIDNVLSERVKMKLRGKRFPNVMIIGQEVEPYLLTHPTIISRVNAGQTPGQGADATLNDLAKFFKVPKVVVASAVYNTAAENKTKTNAFILDSKSVWLGYVAPSPAVATPTAGYRFVDQELSGNAMGVRNWRYWDQPKRSWYIEGAIDDVYKLVSSSLGTFLGGIVV